MLWLYDSRDRMTTGKRVLHILPLTGAGMRKAWDIVLTAEVPSERDDYQYLVDDDAESDDINSGMFNDYWAEYGWYLMPVDAEGADIPHDVEEVKP